MQRISTYHEFYTEHCLPSGTALDPRILAAAEAKTIGLYSGSCDELGNIYTPTHELAAVAEAGRILRENPYTVLGKAVNMAQIDERNIGLKTLGRIVNDTIFHDMRDDRHLNKFISKPLGGMDAPESDELEFAMVLAKLINPDSEEIGCQVICDDHHALLVRKGIGQASALSLVELSINGVHYPAGSIMRVDLVGDTHITVRSMVVPKPQPEQAEFLMPAAVTRIGFLRLSAYAFPPSERRHFGTKPFAMNSLATAALTIQNLAACVFQSIS